MTSKVYNIFNKMVCLDGHFVDSRGEMIVNNILTELKIPHQTGVYIPDLGINIFFSLFK